MPPVKAKIKTVSFTLMRRILPNRKLKISIEKPPEKLIITSPAAMPEDNSTAIEASPDMLYLSLIL